MGRNRKRSGTGAVTTETKSPQFGTVPSDYTTAELTQFINFTKERLKTVQEEYNNAVKKVRQEQEAIARGETPQKSRFGQTAQQELDGVTSQLERIKTDLADLLTLKPNDNAVNLAPEPNPLRVFDRRTWGTTLSNAIAALEADLKSKEHVLPKNTKTNKYKKLKKENMQFIADFNQQAAELMLQEHLQRNPSFAADAKYTEYRTAINRMNQQMKELLSQSEPDEAKVGYLTQDIGRTVKAATEYRPVLA